MPSLTSNALAESVCCETWRPLLPPNARQPPARTTLMRRDQRIDWVIRDFDSYGDSQQDAPRRTPPTIPDALADAV